MLCRLTEELDSQQVASDEHSHRLASVMSALDELQERRELSDSGRGRLRGLLSAPLQQFSGGSAGGSAGGSVGGLPPRGSGLIRQSSRLSGTAAHSASSSPCAVFFLKENKKTSRVSKRREDYTGHCLLLCEGSRGGRVM